MKKTMFQLFGSVLRDDAEKGMIHADTETWANMLKVSAKHDLAHLIGYALRASDIKIDEALQKEFEKSMNTAIFRYARISCEMEAISHALEQAQIRFIPLKGAVIRNDYREPWLRTSCDIDILIHDEDIEKVKDVFVRELKYTYVSSWNYELSFHTPTSVHIELHHVLNDEVGEIDRVLSTVWDRADPIEPDSFCYEMRDEMYYFYHIAHMAKHFVNGGCGIRPFMDVWVLNHRRSFDREKRYTLLEEAGLLKFAQAAEQLADVWFHSAPHTPITETLEQFIWSGGLYGTVGNRVAVQQAKKGGKLRYILSRIWEPYTTLKLRYPILVRHPWMLPFCQIARWFHGLFSGSVKRGMSEFGVNRSMSGSEQAQAEWMLRQLGLH